MASGKTLYIKGDRDGGGAKTGGKLGETLFLEGSGEAVLSKL